MDSLYCVLDNADKIHICKKTGIMLTSSCGQRFNLFQLGQTYKLVSTYYAAELCNFTPYKTDVVWCRKCGSTLTKVFQ